MICLAAITLCCAGGILLVGNAGQKAQTSLDELGLSGYELVVMPREGSYLNADLDKGIQFGLLPELLVSSNISSVVPLFHMTYEMAGGNSRYAEIKLIAIDQASDSPHLTLINQLKLSEIKRGECIAGSQANFPSGTTLLDLDGYQLSLAGRLAPTGTSFDQYVLITDETARIVVQWFKAQDQTLAGQLSVGSLYLVKALPDADMQLLSSQILLAFPGVTVFDSTSFFAMGRQHMQNLLFATPWLFGLVMLILFLFTGLAFTVVVNERKREIGILRAIGFPRSFVLKSFFVEGFIMALTGGISGLVLFMILGASLSQVTLKSLGLSLSTLPPAAWLTMMSMTLATVILSVPLAALLPIWRISREEPATTMKS